MSNPQTQFRTVVRMPTEMQRAMQAEARRRDVSDAELIRQAIAHEIGMEYRPIARWPKEPEISTDS